MEKNTSDVKISLCLAKDLELPAEAVTQTFAILAKRGVGKTYTASVMVEEMLKSKLHVAVVDPIGVWWGLRTSADGKKPGLPIIVLGGEHGDVPLEPTSGEIVANLIVDQNLSVVIDLSLMRKNEQKRFMIGFAETLYHRNRNALHIVLDEADEFAPQRPMGDDARMLGAIEDLVRRGRARGIGLTLITQRPAVLNKNVLTQIEVLVAMRVTSPQDRNQIGEWVKYHADTDQATDMLSSLPALPIGTAWFWSPGWLDLFQKVQIRMRDTLDSSSTPKVGEQRTEATKVAEVDIAALRKQLSAAIEKAESEDPKVLRRRVAELEKALAKQAPKVEVREIPVLTAEQLHYLQVQLPKIVALLEPAIRVLTTESTSEAPQPTPRPQPSRTVQAALTSTTAQDSPVDIQSLPAGARRILEAVANHAPMKFTRSQVGTLSKFSARGGAFGAHVATLKRLGLLIELNGEMYASDLGIQAAGVAHPAPQTPDETLRMWRAALREGEGRLLDQLVALYPDSVSRDELAQLTGYTASGGGFGGSLSSLRRNGLIEVTGNDVKASDALMRQ